ncbi:selenocysteine lyase isoform X1 [Brachionus plicatilis]|uniref:Selenocysteine lyase n=1 Tax=Brachionus plicatilis TaxID=10195 RepID=A0A3M7P420_BRAPC|nr:selenocysteine lyase isoform X1 [Brachionus plicatilis]
MCENSNEKKVYLDYNATTPLDAEVIQSITESLCKGWSNPSSQYNAGKDAKAEINKSRGLIAQMINANFPSDIVFLSGGTEANNVVFNSVYIHYQNLKNKINDLDPLPHFIISNVEHDSVKLVAEHYEKNGLGEVSVANVDSTGAVRVKDILNMIRPNTILVSIMLANNETGVIQPVEDLSAEIKKLNGRRVPIFVHTDAAQAIGKINVDAEKLMVDYLTIVGHKFYGPKIGALYARNCLGNDSEKSPLFHLFQGAGQESGLRPGTENTPMIVGLGKACELVTKNLEKYSKQMQEMRDYLENKLIEVFGVENLRFNGKSVGTERLPNTCNVSFISSPKFKGFLILKNCDYLEASTGSCCHSGEFRASKILLAMNIDLNVAANALRLSVGRDTTKQEIELVVQDIQNSLKKILN